MKDERAGTGPPPHPHMFTTPEFREAFDRLFPDCSEADRMLHQHFLVSGLTDEYGAVVTPVSFVRPLLDTGHRCSLRETLIGWASRQGLSMSIVDSDRRESLATTVVVDYPEELVELAREERCRVFTGRNWYDGLVDFITGQAVNSYIVRREQETYRKSVIARMARADDHPAVDLLRYLNTRPVKVQRGIILANLPAVRQMLGSMPTGRIVCRMCRDGRSRPAADRCMAVREHNVRVLHWVAQHPYVMYRAVKGTPRLIADGACSIYFSRELRKCLYAGCWEADLKSAQLAILAALAGSTKLGRFLENGGDWWTEMADHCGVDLESAKSVLKRATYAVVFGAGKRRVRRLLAVGGEESAGVGSQAADRFLGHPLVVELLECRSRLLKGIRENGYMQDAFGADIRLHRFWHRRSSEHRARSVLAWVAQSWELRIMTAIVPVVRRRRGIHIIAWIHDGCVLHLRGRPQAVETCRQELVRAVDDLLREIEMETGLSIRTRLIVEQLPPADEQLAAREKQMHSRTVKQHRSRRPVRAKAARALTGRPITAFADRVRRAA